MPMPLFSFCFSLLGKREVHELDLHVEEMHLFQEIFNVLVLNVEVGVQTNAC